jgi:hypothetical protein
MEHVVNKYLKKKTPAGFRSTISAGELLQTYTLHHSASGHGKCILT